MILYCKYCGQPIVIRIMSDDIYYTHDRVNPNALKYCLRVHLLYDRDQAPGLYDNKGYYISKIKAELDEARLRDDKLNEILYGTVL